MKALILMFLVTTNIFSCDCQKLNYKHKSEAEIAAMTPAQRFDEMVSEQLYHMPSLNDETADIINKYIHQDGVKILPVLIEFFNDYDPKKPDCEDRKGMRAVIAAAYLGDLDRSIVRLRGIKEGVLAIEALERVVARMKADGFEKVNHNFNGRFNIASFELETLKGTNIRDESIRDTFWVRRKIKMSDQDLLDFTDFLIKRDPTYPGWSQIENLKDYSQLNEAGNPKQVLILTEPERFFKAYEEFKAAAGGRKP